MLKRLEFWTGLAAIAAALMETLNAVVSMVSDLPHMWAMRLVPPNGGPAQMQGIIVLWDQLTAVFSNGPFLVYGIAVVLVLLGLWRLASGPASRWLLAAFVLGLAFFVSTLWNLWQSSLPVVPVYDPMRTVPIVLRAAAGLSLLIGLLLSRVVRRWIAWLLAVALIIVTVVDSVWLWAGETRAPWGGQLYRAPFSWFDWASYLLIAAFWLALGIALILRARGANRQSGDYLPGNS